MWRMSSIFLRTWYHRSGTALAVDRVLQVDEHHGLAGLGVAAHEVEVGQLLQLLLDAVGDLLQRVGRRWRPATAS